MVYHYFFILLLNCGTVTLIALEVALGGSKSPGNVYIQTGNGNRPNKVTLKNIESIQTTSGRIKIIKTTMQSFYVCTYWYLAVSHDLIL